MVKKMLCAAALIAALITLANAQDAKAPAHAITPQAIGQVKAPTPPAVCKPCLFYGGDWPSTGTNWVAFFNGNFNLSGTIYNASNYVPFRVPSNQSWTVYGLFTNNIFYNYSTGTNSFTLDPNTTEWAINSGVTSGSGGTIVASGTATGRLVSTGLSYGGFYFEYSAVSTIGLTGGPVLGPGEYWLTVAADCTNTTTCTEYAYNTDTLGLGASNAFGPAEPKCQAYQNSPTFGLTFVNDCTQGYGKGIAGQFSAGVFGKAGH
jgi:hypothetical protein